MTADFSIEYSTVWGENLFLTGADRIIPMRWNKGGIWTASVEDCTRDFLSCYRYFVLKDGRFHRMEWTSHHRELPEDQNNISFTDQWKDAPQADGGPRAAGTAIPVFSLRSRDSFGIGEFLDLKKMVDWAVLTGQKFIQILPVNDTTKSLTWKDSYPYNASSSFALNPMYLNLPAAGLKEDRNYRRLRDELNACPTVDYERVASEKMRLMRDLYERTGEDVLNSREFRKFLKANREWLLPYSAFCILRDRHGSSDFNRWGKDSTCSKSRIDKTLKENPHEAGFYHFIQFHLDSQLSGAASYARSKGVSLKGDLPIGVSRDSADAWCFPKLFNLDSQAGAPPDAFSADGQNWGFPTYNWEEMARDGYSWWKRRLRKMSEYFDAFRIDHLLGFFRIWEIPLPLKSGLEGHFSPALPLSETEIAQAGLPLKGLFVKDPRVEGMWHPKICGSGTPEYSALPDCQKERFDRLHDDFFFRRQDDFWKDEAMKKLPALLCATDMLACGEDLGMIPACVPQIMDWLKILSLKIQRMPSEGTFGHPEKYPYLSVCTTSSHDMNPLRAWWEEDKELTDKYFHEILGENGPAPEECSPEICRKIVMSHLLSPSMLVILPLQDWLSTDGDLRSDDPASERINVPADSDHKWRYRMHITIEDLLGQKVFNESLLKMLEESSRINA